MFAYHKGFFYVLIRFFLTTCCQERKVSAQPMA